LGLVIAPYCSGSLIDNHPGNYTPVMCLLGGFALCGLGCNLVLYFDDIKNRGGILDKVPGATETIAALMATPQIPKKEFVKAAPADYTTFNKDFGEEVEVVVGLPDL